jgi:hypothetical protein
MTVVRTHAGQQTRYEIRDGDALGCALVYSADPDEPATWKVLLPGPDGTEDLYGTLEATGVGELRGWLSGLVGGERADALAAAVAAEPPPPAHLATS